MASSVYNVGEWEDEEFGMAFFSSPQIIGHRGLGANTFNNDRKTFLKPSPAIVEENNKLRQGNDASGGGVYRENSLRSCVEASKIEGAFIEVDCQLSKDGDVVLWHDDDVCFRLDSGNRRYESHIQTNEQEQEYQANGEGNVTPRPNTCASRRVSELSKPDLERAIGTDEEGYSRLLRHYKTSLGDSRGQLVPWALPEGERHSILDFSEGEENCTYESNDKVIVSKESDKKPKSEGQIITSLNQLLSETATSLSINIEIKLFHDGEDMPETTKIGTSEEGVSENIEKLVTAIFDTVSAHHKISNNMAMCTGMEWCPRQIIYSSFSPDACVCMQKKIETDFGTLSAAQSKSNTKEGDALIGNPNSERVFFLTDCKPHHLDIRRRSLCAAVNFAHENNLSGVVCEASALLSEIEKSQGQFTDLGDRRSDAFYNTINSKDLTIASYGVANNDEAAVKIQVDSGVRAIITDFPAELKNILSVH